MSNNMNSEDQKYINTISKIHMEIGTALMKIAGYTSIDIRLFRPLIDRMNINLSKTPVKSIDELYELIYNLVEDK
jgi:hypothetical protein